MRGRICALLVITAALALPEASQAATPAAGHLRMAIGTAAGSADFSQTPTRSSFVVLQEWQQEKLHALKAANPAIKVLMYKNLSSMLQAEYGYAGTGVTTQEAEAHPEWFLLNTSGERFTFSSYGYLWAADIGNRSYQDRWLANVTAKLNADKWDGVFVDDANPTIRYHYSPERVALYPSDASYGAATGSALANIGPKLRAKGKLVIGNFADWRNYRTVVGSWLPNLSGGMEEQFTKYGTDPSSGYFTGADWDNELAVLKQTQKMGKYQLTIAHSGSDDVAAARYGWATTLLAANGKASFALHNDYANETWFSEYDYDLGKAVGAETKLASGVHKRTFERGIVLVNPTTGSVPVSFGGRFRGSGVAMSSATTMAPHSGLILLREGVAAPKAPAATNAATAAAPAPAQLPAGGTELAAQPVAPSIAPPASRSTVRPTGRVVVRVRCRSAQRCHRVVHVVLGRSAVVGRRKVTVGARRSARVAIRVDARGRKALAQGKRLRTLVRASA